MEYDVSVKGINELVKTFSNLPKETQRKVIMPSLRSGAKVVKKLAEGNIKSITSNEATGALSRNLAIYNFKKIRGSYRVAVQVKRKAVNTRKIVNGQPVRIGLYGAVLEYGKKNQPPRSWIRKAAREGTQQSVEAVRVEFAKRIDAAVKAARV